jgi:TolB-like protein/DNA-binding winged helix-turn-helix (wHTH) protein
VKKAENGDMAAAGSTRQRRIYQVGDLVIDLGRATVHRGGQPLHVQGLSFDLLALLVESAPDLVTHDEILSRIWKGLVVGPETLSQRIKLLRAALEDDSRAPRYIEVVRGRGCRLVADVRLLEDEVAAPAPTASPVSPESPRKRGWMVAMALMVIAVGVVSFFLMQQGAGARQQLPGSAASASDTSSRPTVAVLPFDTVASEADDRVLVLGIAETLLHRLAQSPELVVIARESSFALQASTDIGETSRRLHANYLITGSVQREGDALRITTHLVDATTGTQLWSRRFDRSRRDLFALQDEIASDVASALQLNVEQQRQISSPQSGTRNLAAWLAYQRGREQLAQRSRDELVAAAGQFEQALQEDPGFAAAMIALAETRILRSMSADSEFWGNSRPEMTDGDRADTLRLISAALQIDAGNGEAFAARAWLQQDLNLALQDARRGVELAPNNATAVRRLAQLVYYVPGRGNSGYDRAARLESLQLLQRAEKIDPLSAPTQLLLSRGHLYSFGNLDQALAIARRLTVEHPEFYPGWVQVGEILWCCRGQVAQAIMALEHARELDPHAQWTRDFLSQAYLDIGDTAAARAVIAGPEFVRSGSHSALLLIEGRYREAIDRSIRNKTSGTTGLNNAVLTQALYAELATGRPRQSSLDAAQNMARGSAFNPGQVALTAAQRLRLGDESARPVLMKAIEDLKDIAYRRGRGDVFLLRDLIHAQLAAAELDGALASFRRAQLPEVRAGSFWFNPRDPLLDPLRKRPEFIEAYTATRMYLAAERREVQRLREQGKLPRYAN